MRNRRLKKAIVELNFFQSNITDEQTIRRQRYATRIYIILYVLTVFGIGLFAAFSPQLINDVIYFPTNLQFNKLMRKYSTTIQCLCSKIGIAYETFVHVDVQFHQVCSSRFVQKTWIDSIMQQQYQQSNIRYHLAYFWQIIADFCHISNQTWIDVIINFGQSYILSPMALNEQVVQSQTKMALYNSISLAKTILKRDLLVIQRTTIENQFISGLTTNFYLGYLSNISQSSHDPQMIPRIYNNCSCLNRHGCPHPLVINTNSNNSIPGMIADCYMTDATLRSTLECYYNSTCFSQLHEQSNVEVELLSSKANKYFLTNSTVQMLIDDIMIDDLNIKILFELFYQQCRPARCFYSYTKYFSLIDIITTIIGMFGPSAFILKLLMHFIVKFLLRDKSQETNTSERPLGMIIRLYQYLGKFRFT
ncbi:unnamed protein product [Adineta ricciae]|uniref:Uncharacterized protein n=1 Tax=Adineta ricciae TaxID=249248 RepID=A0A815X0W9_ADIRI|nr:unnamed protein product [Adineta ricciae]